MPPSTARTLKGPRRLARRSARRSPSPRWQFLRGFLKNPVMVGSIIPSSRILIEKMLSKVDWENTKVFVEYGPGVGEAIAAATSQVVRPGGAFLVYQFSPKVLEFIRPHFDKIDRGFEWINVPPATLFWAWKKNGEALD